MNFLKKFNFWGAFFLFFVYLVSPLYSSTVQVLTFKDGGSDLVEVSQKEINIIRLPSSDTKIVANSPNVDIKILGENALLQYIGEIQPTSLVLLSKKGVYSITIIPRGIPSATIVIKDEQHDKTEAYQWESSNAYVKALTGLIKSMYQENPPDGYKAEKIEKSVTPLWEGTQLFHKFRYYGAVLVGDVYEIRNVSDQDMVIKPSEFYAKGVLAVSIDSETLTKGKSTLIYIVRQSSSSESSHLFKSVKTPLLR